MVFIRIRFPGPHFDIQASTHERMAARSTKPKPIKPNATMLKAERTIKAGDPEERLTPRQVAGLLLVTESRVKQFIRQGRLPVEKYEYLPGQIVLRAKRADLLPLVRRYPGRNGWTAASVAKWKS